MVIGIKDRSVEVRMAAVVARGSPSVCELRSLLATMGYGYIEPTAYDTAWVARVPDGDCPRRPAFPAALDWLLKHQNPDGSWGSDLRYHHDRVLSTLVAFLTLDHWQREMGSDVWSPRLEAAQRSLWQHVQSLQCDPYDLIGFELILPTLLEEARGRGAALPYESFEGVSRMCESKLRLIPPELMYTRRVSTIFSAEFLGDNLDASRVSGLQDDNGSVASSPSATAFCLLKDPGNARARDYLARVVERHGGAAPAVDPIDVFETAWVLFNAARVWPDASELAAEIAPHVDLLRDEYRRKNGAGYNSSFAVPDLDGTSMVFRVLTWAGIDPDPAVLAQFESDDHFWCFPFERNPSISAHVHLLEALRAAPEFPHRQRMIGKVLDFLARSRTLRTFWFDKWHASPYYTTAHAVIALREDRQLAEDAVFWIVNTQNEDGSWGYYDASTAEETAYCVQALALHPCNDASRDAIVSAIRRGVDYLASSAERQACNYRPLWIGKSLYAPRWVVHSAVLSALALGEAV